MWVILELWKEGGDRGACPGVHQTIPGEKITPICSVRPEHVAGDDGPSSQRVA